MQLEDEVNFMRHGYTVLQKKLSEQYPSEDDAEKIFVCDSSFVAALTAPLLSVLLHLSDR